MAGMYDGLLRSILTLNQLILENQRLLTPKPPSFPLGVAAPIAATPSPPPQKTAKGVSRKPRPTIDASRFTAKDLTQEELEQLVILYGLNIEDVYELSPGQRWMFSKAKVVMSTFFTPALFRIAAKLDVAAFRKNVDVMMQRHDNLRTVFASEGLDRPLQVVLKSHPAELTLRDLSSGAQEDIDDELTRRMEADRRRGFDLQRDSLLRITVYKLGEDQYAILVSQPHINYDGVSAGVFMKELFVDFMLNEMGQKTLELPEVQYKSYMRWLSGKDKEETLAYWRKELSGLGTMTLTPGRRVSGSGYEQASSTLEIDAERSKQVMALQGQCQATLFNILQAAWGAMLCSIHGTQDVAFGAISSGRPEGVENAELILGGMVNALPVRVNYGEETTLRALAKGLQDKFALTMKYSQCAPDEIAEALHRDEPLFDHLLNSHLAMAGVSLDGVSAVPGVTLLDVQSFDHLSADLCVYFARQKGQLYARFAYNALSFSPERIRLLQDNFARVLDQMCENPDLMVKDVQTDGRNAFDRLAADEREQKQKLLTQIARFKLFEGVGEAALNDLIGHGREKMYAGSDVIERPGRQARDVRLILDGHAEIARQSAAGWLSTVRVAKAGDLTSVEALYDGETFEGEVCAVDDVRTLEIPRDLFREFLLENPGAALNLIDIVNNRLSVMTTLWIGSDAQ